MRDKRNTVSMPLNDGQRAAMEVAADKYQVSLGGMALAALCIVTNNFTDFSGVAAQVERHPAGRPIKKKRREIPHA